MSSSPLKPEIRCEYGNDRVELAVPREARTRREARLLARDPAADPGLRASAPAAPDPVPGAEYRGGRAGRRHPGAGRTGSERNRRGGRIQPGVAAGCAD